MVMSWFSGKVGCLQSRCFRLGAWGCNFTVNHDYRRNSRLRRSCECILISTNIDGLKCIDIGYNFTSTRFLQDVSRIRTQLWDSVFHMFDGDSPKKQENLSGTAEHWLDLTRQNLCAWTLKADTPFTPSISIGEITHLLTVDPSVSCSLLFFFRFVWGPLVHPPRLPRSLLPREHF